MKWYEGGIPAAIQTARQNKAVFIVFISGEAESSSKMESELHQQNVTQLCEENNCVAVKLLANSNDSKFFSQIYPVVVIPSTFLIGDTGVPLEVIGEVKSSEDFFNKVKAALEMQNKKASSSEQPGPSSQNQTREEIQTATDYGENGATAASPERTTSSDGSGDDGISVGQEKELKEKVERAKELVDEKRQEKLQKEFEEEKRKELERRNVGQGVQKLRQTQKEMEILEAKKEHQKEKEEDRLARQRVKEEIARDRAEKAARFQQAKDARSAAAEEAKKQKLMEQQADQAAEQSRRNEFARIQFRLPDGSSVTQQFPASDKFESVYNFISSRVGSGVSLCTTFPRHTFTISDHSLTLQELSLVPSAAILVIPAGMSSSGVRGSSSAALSVTNILFAPFIFLWNLLSSLLGFGGSSSSSSSSSGTQRSTENPSARGGDQKPNSAYQRGSSSASRREGAIHRFHNTQDDDDDDDRNTWNGNSTQQM